MVESGLFCNNKCCRKAESGPLSLPFLYNKIFAASDLNTNNELMRTSVLRMSNNEPIGHFFVRVTSNHAIALTLIAMGLAYFVGSKLLKEYYIKGGATVTSLSTSVEPIGHSGEQIQEATEITPAEYFKTRFLAEHEKALPKPSSFHGRGVALADNVRFVFKLDFKSDRIQITHFDTNDAITFQLSHEGLSPETVSGRSDPAFYEIAHSIATGVALARGIDTRLYPIIENSEYASLEKVFHNGRILQKLSLSTGLSSADGLLGSSIFIQESDFNVVEISGILGCKPEHKFDFYDYQTHAAFGLPKHITSTLPDQQHILIELFSIN